MSIIGAAIYLVHDGKKMSEDEIKICYDKLEKKWKEIDADSRLSEVEKVNESIVAMWSPSTYKEVR